MRDLWPIFLVWMFAFAPARGQQTGQTVPPSAPSAPQPSASSAKPSFTLPPVGYSPPDAAAPDDKKKLLCDAPREGVFAQATVSEAEAKTGETRSYVQLLMSQISRTWESHLPREARDAWAKGRIVRLRFLVMPDGSYSSPEVTVSSGKSSYDYAAIDAVRSRDTFPPLPEGITKPLPVCMTFKSNVGLPDTPQGWYGPASK
jgi:TonB family protein